MKYKYYKYQKQLLQNKQTKQNKQKQTKMQSKQTQPSAQANTPPQNNLALRLKKAVSPVLAKAHGSDDFTPQTSTVPVQQETQQAHVELSKEEPLKSKALAPAPREKTQPSAEANTPSRKSVSSPKKAVSPVLAKAHGPDVGTPLPATVSVQHETQQADVEPVKEKAPKAPEKARVKARAPNKRNRGFVKKCQKIGDHWKNNKDTWRHPKSWYTWVYDIRTKRPKRYKEFCSYFFDRFNLDFEVDVWQKKKSSKTVSTPTAKVAADSKRPAEPFAKEATTPTAKVAADSKLPAEALAKEATTPTAKVAADSKRPAEPLAKEATTPTAKVAADSKRPAEALAKEATTPTAKVADDSKLPAERFAKEATTPPQKVADDSKLPAKPQKKTVCQIQTGVKNRKKPNDVFFTPRALVKIHVGNVILCCNDARLNLLKLFFLDPCRGEGVYFNNIKSRNLKVDYCEISEGKNYFDYDKPVDVIIANPPFSLVVEFLQKSIELGPIIISFLIPVYALTPPRLALMENSGYYLVRKTTFQWKVVLGPSCFATWIKKDHQRVYGVQEDYILRNYYRVDVWEKMKENKKKRFKKKRDKVAIQAAKKARKLPKKKGWLEIWKDNHIGEQPIRNNNKSTQTPAEPLDKKVSTSDDELVAELSSLTLNSAAFTFVDLCCGMGSFTLSLTRLGGKCLMACDINKNARETYKTNFGNEPLEDIFQLQDVPHCDILCAGFPCQSFSNIGERKGTSDARGAIIYEIARLLKANQIKSFILENVEGLTSHDNGKTLKKIIKLLEDCGYKTKHQVLKCSDYGVPQMRKRLFIVGFKNNLFKRSVEYKFPKPFPLETTLSSLLKKSFEKEVAYTVRVGGRGSGVNSRHNWDTYRIKGTDKQHKLTVEDCKRIQDFPKDFVLMGNQKQQYELLGNTIPTNLTYEVGKGLLVLLRKSDEPIPVSVIDVKGVGKNGIRGDQKQGDGTSSRSEYSPFPLDVAKLCVGFFLKDKNTILDVYAGWGERHYMCALYLKTYYGIDISPKAIEYAKKNFNVDNKLGDSRTEPLIQHDGLLTCPPYFDLETYEGKNNLSRCENWKQFLIHYELIFKRCVEKADAGAIYCIVVGDWRAKHIYYNLSYETQRIMEKLGMILKDKVILSQKKTTNYCIMLPQSTRLGYTAKVHGYLLVFEKP